MDNYYDKESKILHERTVSQIYCKREGERQKKGREREERSERTREREGVREREIERE